uniref:Immunoglobulin domain-containing protein n=1 Tax=Varanus komodoensis TaxID=61221 RepID=A0A8D2KVI7_VARKO
MVPSVFVMKSSILSSCFLLTRAQDGRPQVIPITWSPQYPTAGENVTLTPGGTLEKVVSCSWFRGTVTDVAKRILVYYVPPLTQGQVNGPSYTGRETVDLECSLHIQNLTLTDSGNYTVSKEGGVTAIGHVMIKVSGMFHSFFSHSGLWVPSAVSLEPSQFELNDRSKQKSFVAKRPPCLGLPPEQHAPSHCPVSTSKFHVSLPVCPFLPSRHVPPMDCSRASLWRRARRFSDQFARKCPTTQPSTAFSTMEASSHPSPFCTDC